MKFNSKLLDNRHNWNGQLKATACDIRWVEIIEMMQKDKKVQKFANFYDPFRNIPRNEERKVHNVAKKKSF